MIARIVPGDPARIALGPLATAKQVAEMRQEMGLDDPLCGSTLELPEWFGSG